MRGDYVRIKKMVREALRGRPLSDSRLAVEALVIGGLCDDRAEAVELVGRILKEWRKAEAAEAEALGMGGR
jgi:hypothetical protein